MNARPMKPSGLGWAPRIPAHWEASKICLVARLESGHTPSRQEPAYWVPEECNIPWFSLGDVWQIRDGVREYLGETYEKISSLGIANSGARVLPAGTVVLSRTASVGFSGIMPIPMATTQDFANWVPGRRLRSEFLLYALRAMREELHRSMIGSTHQTIYMPDIRRLSIPLPPVEEQVSIVAALRARLPAIDELIARKERLVALLQERRQALITHAVTRGLEHDATVATGDPLLPALPAGWSLEELRQRIAGIEQGWSPSCEGRPAEEQEWGVLKVGCVNYGRFSEQENKALPPDLDPLPRLEIHPGDVLVSRANTRELVGSAAFVRHARPRLLLCDKLFRIRYVASRTDPEFLTYLLQSRICRAQLERDASGASGSMQNIGQDSIRRLKFGWPSLDAQREIVRHLDLALTHCDRSASLTTKSVAKLREYRQALITAAVTGQLDVATSASTQALEGVDP